MTCQELHSYYEDPVRVDLSFRVDSDKVSAHAADCAECGSFVEAQRDLGKGLHLIRECIAEPSDSLDAAVLSAYRKQAVGQPVGSTSARRRGSFAILGWSAALAGIVVLVAVILFSSRRKEVLTGAQPPLAPPMAVSQGTDGALRGLNSSTVTKRELSHAAAYPARRRSSALPTGALGNPLSVGFRSLMFCDELSCGGAMELIRVQLPPSAAALAPASASASSPVFADVLVGPDGIARGIRIVE